MNNSKDDRFGSFFQRVETERIVLRIVNEAFPNALLHGITQSAVETWGRRVAQISDPKILGCNGGEIIEILLAISARINSLADQSRVVFAGETSTPLATHELIDELKAICQTKHQAINRRPQADC
jgi:hypothetical protein